MLKMVASISNCSTSRTPQPTSKAKPPNRTMYTIFCLHVDFLSSIFSSSNFLILLRIQLVNLIIYVT